ncbi:unnamed protein product [Allacma fusca]|uniref:Gamma-aminobutyric acid receptor subunit beta n=1 Tax=Allacma fusca TaxID=39272 RepID=A0A8J2K179_9HEXA|nr:unnamed protein product [Allacma fusca]
MSLDRACNLVIRLICQYLVIISEVHSVSSKLIKDNSEELPKIKNMNKLVMTRLEELLKDYDKQSRPNEGGQTDVIDIAIHMQNIGHVSEVSMEYTADIYFRQQWVEPRLSFQDQNLTFEDLRIDSISERIWHPDTFFPNEVSSFVHSATVQNEFLRLSDSGMMTKSTRYTITASCPMNLQYFPMDTQICTLIIESYGYRVGELEYHWAKVTEKLDMASLFTEEFVPNFRVDGYRVDTTARTIRNETYPSITLGIQLSRYMGYYLIQIYWPCASLVVVSWFGFWMDDDSSSERISLGATTILTITMLSSSISGNSPKIPYVKAVDVYVGICFLFVFAALVENIMVGYVKKKNVFASVKKSANFIQGFERTQTEDLKRQAFQVGFAFGALQALKTKFLRKCKIPCMGQGYR